ncbi:MAG: alpha/beta hydrolase [Deltaproteobacteria bacterium]|nr:alpha/beta hydrolase [Deltaproteobacteria bacterium]
MIVTWLATKLLFFPIKSISFYPSQMETPYEEVRFKNDEGLLLHGWFFPGTKPDRTLLFLHGNAGNIGDRLDHIKQLLKIGWNIFIFDYRGYGGSEGSPSIEGLQKDTDAAYRWLVSGKEGTKFLPEQIVVWGESLGGAYATDLATREPLRALILQSTFTSLHDIAQTHYPFIPKPIVPDIYRSIDKVRKIRSPLLVIHGTSDETVPFWMGKKLFESAPHPKRFYEVKEALHNNGYEIGKKEYLSQIEVFLNEAGF